MNKEIEKAIETLKNAEHYINCDYEYLEIETPLKTAIDLSITALEAQQADAWISVKSELDHPFENGEYQVTIRYENFAGIYIKTGIASCHGGKWTILGNQPVITNKKIIAWKPLDEPWKEEQP